MKGQNKYIFWNCASGLFNKKPSVEKYIVHFNPSLFFISECDISPSHMLKLLSIPGYHIDVSKTIDTQKKGRLLAYVKTSAGFIRRHDLELTHNDVLVYSSKHITVAGVYQGFKTYDNESVISNLDRLLFNLKLICERSQQLIIGGDFNVDPQRSDQKSRLLEIWQTECGLDQLVTNTTRMRYVDGNLQQSMIDLVFVKELVTRPTVKTTPSEVSDHHLIVTETSFPEDPSIKFQKQVIVDWRNFNPEIMCRDLKTNLSEIRLSNSIDEMDRELTIAIVMSMNKLIPKRVVHVRRDTDVINYHIEAVKKKRDRLIKKARKNNCQLTMLRVKELNKVIKAVVNRERDRMIRNKMKNSSASTFWNTVNTLLGRNTKDNINIAGPEGKYLSDEETAQAFSEFFKEKVDKLINLNPIQDPKVMFTKTGISNFTTQEVQKALESFKPKKSSGPDEIPLIVLKLCYEALQDHIMHLFTLISTQGKIPDTWKLARLKPIFKKGDHSKIENYRPISNLNSISKLFERCLLNRISVLDTDGPNQHGFKPAHSTITASIELQSFLACQLDKGKQCLMYSTDLSAAFDLIRPGIFVSKARKVIPDEGIIGLMYDFITDRKAYVEIGQHNSSVFRFQAGCPQGSTLGPKIFNTYCNDLHRCITDGFLTSYADDSYVVTCAENHAELLEKTTQVMKNHLYWLKDNGMVCNVEKTELMILNSDTPTTLVVEGRQIISQKEMKVLGITFDSNLNWSSQVSKVISKTNRMLHGLKKIRRHLNRQQSKQVTTSFYFSVLYYGIELWYHRNLAFHLKQKIRSAHYRALRLIHGEKTRDQLDMEGKRATPDEWANYAAAKLLVKMVQGSTPTRLLEDTLQNSYSERRQPGRLFFYDASSKKIGRQCFKNRLSCVSKQMKFDWLVTERGALRTSLKKCFFSYVGH